MNDSCGCVYSDGDEGESCDFMNTNEQKARKKHRCTECRRTISPGERYEYTAGSWDGDFSVYKTCEHCLSLRKEFFCNTWVYTSVIDDLQYHLEEVGGKVKSECLLRLTDPARGTVIKMIDTIWGNNE